MTSKVNSKTTLKSIKRMVKNDFGLNITNEWAKDIKAAYKSGALLWTGVRLVATNVDLQIYKADNGTTVRYYGQGYSAADFEEHCC